MGNARSGGDHRSKGGADPFPRGNLPSKPANIERDEAQLWDKLLDQIPADVLRGIDAVQLHILCQVVCQKERVAKMVRDDPADLAAYRVFLGLAQHVSRLSSQFGLSPVDRKRLDYEEPVEDDAEEWAES